MGIGYSRIEISSEDLAYLNIVHPFEKRSHGGKEVARRKEGRKIIDSGTPI